MNHIKKKSLFCLLIAMLFVMTACTAKSVQVEQLEGYDVYESEGQSFKIQYPSEWSAVDGNITNEDIQGYEDLFGPDAASMLENADFSTVATIWYDFDGAAEGFTPNVNLNITEDPGLKLKDLKSADNQKQIQEIYDQNFAGVFLDFKPRGGIEGKDIGNNYFLNYKYDCSVNGIQCTFYQAVTIRDDKKQMYVFTFATLRNQFDQTASQFEKMLSTLELK